MKFIGSQWENRGPQRLTPPEWVLMCVILSNFPAKLDAGYTVFPPKWKDEHSMKKSECYCSTQIIAIRQWKKIIKVNPQLCFRTEFSVVRAAPDQTSETKTELVSQLRFRYC